MSSTTKKPINLHDKRGKLVLSVLLILTVISASISVFELLPRNVTELQYSEKTLFLGNDTLLNGNYPIHNFTNPPAYLYLSPFNHELYIHSYNVTYNQTFVMNTTTQQIVQELDFPKSWAWYEFDFNAGNGVTYVPYDSYNGSKGMLELDKNNHIVAHVSTPYVYSSITYDPYNSELYAYRGIAENNISESQLVTLNSSFYPQKEIYFTPQNAMLEYNPVNHLMYSLNGNSNTITVVAPNDSILKNVTVGSLPDGIALDPSSGSVYTANVFNISEVTSNLSVIDSTNFPIYQLGGIEAGIAFDSASHVAVVGLGIGELAVMQGARNLIGYVKVGEVPNNAVYDPYNHQVYVANFDSSSISILNITVNHTSQIVIPWISSGTLFVLLVADSWLYMNWKRMKG
ncbi:MAG: YncE family protein [Thermoplasmataceae archaeon]